ncbi:MAG: FadR/GntR family transcriptional regulator [Desulfomonilia bacterium]
MHAPVHFARPVTRSRLHENIVSVILKKIIKKELRCGERLPSERNLALSFDVNRSTIREALKKLESLDVIEIRHGDGVYVKDYLESGNLELIQALFYMDNSLDEDILWTLLEVRRVLVPEMVSIAALNRTGEDLEKLSDLVFQSMDLSTMERDIRIHHRIALASKNILYLILLNFFTKFFRQFGHIYFDKEENRLRSETFHQDILRAIRDRDQAAAKQIMLDVLTYVEHAIRTVLDERNHIQERT